MGLRDDIIGITAEAAEQRKQAAEDARAAQDAERKKDVDEAIKALDFILSDESIRTIVKMHAEKGRGSVASIAVKNGPVTLAGPGPRGELLPLTFAAKTVVASKQFETAAIRDRIATLKEEGVFVSHRYEIHPDVLVISFDYGSLCR